ncbi:o-antigen ABC exporter permease protein [Clostridium sp. CAG:632]|jgi:lipopolysaccharide transport system permease protein|nr:ABC transporter permease [Clostridium sp.]CCY58032.1 o-antigen ABC exporter permease protein [Clostridium sp. CAG:632]
MKAIKELYAYREMIVGLVRRDLRGRYKGSVLGFLWTFVNPLLQLVVYTMVFSVIMKNGIEKYYIYLFVGLVPWIFFSTSVTGGANSILSSKDMVKKIYFPREVLPISVVTSGFINMLFCFIVIFAALFISGIGINPVALLFLPIIMIVEYFLALGFALLSSALTVYFRDLEYILGIITMAWMYLTPVMYPETMVPENLLWILKVNPMTSVIMAYRDILYYKQIPQLETLLQALFVGIVFCILGHFVFCKLQKGFVEEM